MKFTNELNLPAPLYRALTHDTYIKVGDVSVTELLKSPRQRLLAKRHDNEITKDASGNLWTLLGRAVHHIIEENSKDIEGLTEERLTTEVKGPLKTWVLSGQADLLHRENGHLILSDYKCSGVFAFLLSKATGYVKPEWETQLNIYRWLFALHGFVADKLQIGGILRDWKLSEYEKRGRDYPSKPIMLPEAAMWPLDEVERYVKERVAVHQVAEPLADKDLPKCTPDERWERGEKWAVYERKKDGAPKQRAFRLFDTDIEAEDCAKTINGKVEHRKGRSMRCCPEYCDGFPWCNCPGS